MLLNFTNFTNVAFYKTSARVSDYFIIKVGILLLE